MLTPEDIQSREFLVSLRGYDRDEVHAFLDEVAEEFARLSGQAAPATPAADDDVTPVAEPEPEPAPPTPAASFAAIGAETQRILEAAQEAADAIREKAVADAQAIKDEQISQAEVKVDQLEAEAAAINQQIADLTSRREELAGRLRQAREIVDLALLEMEPPAAEAPGDATTSVLAAAEEEADAADTTDAVGGGGGAEASSAPAGTPAPEAAPATGDAAGDDAAVEDDAEDTAS